MELKQPSLFTRLAAVEAELQTLRDTLDGLKEDHDALRADRDEWRWRAERVLADREMGILGRWSWRVEQTLGFAVARLRLLLQERAPEIPRRLGRFLLRFAATPGRGQAAFAVGFARFKLHEPQDDGTVALAGPPHGSHPIDDGGLDLDEASVPVALHGPSR